MKQELLDYINKNAVKCCDQSPNVEIKGEDYGRNFFISCPECDKKADGDSAMSVLDAWRNIVGVRK